jgi:hypothetical protein
MPKYSIFVGQQEPAANQYLTDLDSRILDVSYRMLLHQNQGDPMQRADSRSPNSMRDTDSSAEMAEGLPMPSAKLKPRSIGIECDVRSGEYPTLLTQNWGETEVAARMAWR